MRFLFRAANDANKCTLIAPVDYGWALVLMSKQLLVWDNLLTALVSMAALELDFAQEVPSHPVDPIELTLVSTKRTGVRVLLKPVSLAISA